MNIKQTFKFPALTLACVLCISSPAAAQTAPSLISFQGRLTDSLNNPLAGSYNFAFAIYAAQTGGSPLWSESQNGITVANGVLMAELGSGTPIQDSVFSAAQRYLEITVNGTTLAPRQRLLSVPYAMNAQALGGRGLSALVSIDTAQIISGAKTFTADISMSGTARMTNLPAPAAAGDAATKAYVDTVVGGSQDSTLSSTQTFTGQNTFLNQVTVSSDVYLSAGRINLQGNIVTTAGGLLDASKLANTVPSASLDASSVTKRGNTFNGAGQLVLLDPSGKLPGLDGSLLTNVAAGNVNAAGVLPGTFVSGVLLPAAQVQPGSLGSGVIVSSLAAGAVYPGSFQPGIYNIDIFGNAGTVSNGIYTTTFYNDPPWLTGLATAKIDLSTVTAALAGKLSNSASVPASLIDLSTVTAALSGKLSGGEPIPQGLVNLSTVTAALDLKAAASALTAGLAGKLSATETVPAALVDLSTVTSALAGKLSTNGDGSALTNLTAANISPGNLGSSVVASSLAANSVYTASIQDGALSFAKIGVNSCGPNEVLRRNLANTLWICGPDEGGVAGTFTLAPASPLSDVSANPSVYVNDTGGGNFLHFQDSGVDKFTVNSAGLITLGSISAAQIAAGQLPSDVIASSVAVDAIYPGNVKAGSYNINILGNAASVSNGIYSNASYSDPSWITSLSTSKIDLSTVTSALAAKADDGAVTSALAGKASYDEVRTDTTTIAGNMAAGLAARASLAGINTFTSSQTITDARGLYASRHMLGEGVEISSEASTAYGAGIRISSNVYIVGVSSATRYYGDGSNLTGIVATAKWVGYSATALNGNRSGYAGANAECSAAHSGAHVCTNAEILFTINSGLLGSNFPLNVSLWINNGPPGNTMNVNDCNGWVSSGGSEYGALWNRVAAGDGFGSIQPCSATAKYACCK